MSGATEEESVQSLQSGESHQAEFEVSRDEGLNRKKKEDDTRLSDNDGQDGVGFQDDTVDSENKTEPSKQPTCADQTSSPQCDEHQTSIVLEDQYLAEAVAFFAFKSTVQELDKATKKLADIILGERWLTDKKKRKDLPAFVKDMHGKTLSKSAGKLWSVPVLLKFLPWLAKYSLSKFEEDDNVQAAREICQSICAHVGNITLFDVWLDNRPAPPPKDIMLELNEYKLILTKLGCESAVRIVAEKHAWLAQETGKEDFSTCALNMEDVRINVKGEVAKVAVVFPSVSLC